MNGIQTYESFLGKLKGKFSPSKKQKDLDQEYLIEKFSSKVSEIKSDQIEKIDVSKSNSDSTISIVIHPSDEYIRKISEKIITIQKFKIEMDIRLEGRSTYNDNLGRDVDQIAAFIVHCGCSVKISKSKDQWMELNIINPKKEFKPNDRLIERLPANFNLDDVESYFKYLFYQLYSHIEETKKSDRNKQTKEEFKKAINKDFIKDIMIDLIDLSSKHTINDNSDQSGFGFKCIFKIDGISVITQTKRTTGSSKHATFKEASFIVNSTLAEVMKLSDVIQKRIESELPDVEMIMTLVDNTVSIQIDPKNDQ